MRGGGEGGGEGEGGDAKSENEILDDLVNQLIQNVSSDDESEDEQDKQEQHYQHQHQQQQPYKELLSKTSIPNNLNSKLNKLQFNKDLLKTSDSTVTPSIKPKKSMKKKHMNKNTKALKKEQSDLPNEKKNQKLTIKTNTTSNTSAPTSPTTKEVMKRPNKIYRFLLKHGGDESYLPGHFIILQSILISDLLQTYVPPLHHALVLLFIKLQIYKINDIIIPSKPKRNVQQDDATNLIKLQSLTINSKYKYLSMPFMKRHYLGPFSKKKPNELPQETQDSHDEDDDHDDDEQWVHMALQQNSITKSNIKPKKISIKKKPKQSASSAIFKFTTSTITETMAASSSSLSSSRRILGAYPADAPNIQDVASSNGVIALARKYGYGTWDDEVQELDKTQDILHTATLNKLKKQKYYHNNDLVSNVKNIFQSSKDWFQPTSSSIKSAKHKQQNKIDFSISVSSSLTKRKTIPTKKENNQTIKSKRIKSNELTSTYFGPITTKKSSILSDFDTSSTRRVNTSFPKRPTFNKHMKKKSDNQDN